MYTSTWNKYLPVIRILLKKAVASAQVLNLNTPDFEKVNGSKKTFKFCIRFVNGKAENIIGLPLIAKELSDALLADPVVQEQFSRQDFQVALNTKYQLSITAVEAEAVPATTQPEEAAV
jgi:hypothetical protein